MCPGGRQPAEGGLHVSFAKDHMAIVRTFACIWCGKQGRSNIHHVSTGLGGGKNDLMTLPICKKCHQPLGAGHAHWLKRKELGLLKTFWDEGLTNFHGAEYVAEVRALLLADPKIRRRCETRGGRNLKAILQEG